LFLVVLFHKDILVLDEHSSLVVISDNYRTYKNGNES
jgi:hypothetical protein